MNSTFIQLASHSTSLTQSTLLTATFPPLPFAMLILTSEFGQLLLTITRKYNTVQQENISKISPSKISLHNALLSFVAGKIAISLVSEWYLPLITTESWLSSKSADCFDFLLVGSRSRQDCLLFLNCRLLLRLVLHLLNKPWCTRLCWSKTPAAPAGNKCDLALFGCMCLMFKHSHSSFSDTNDDALFSFAPSLPEFNSEIHSK